MFKWYVTRGYPLSELLDTTYIERLFLREAYKDYLSIWEKATDEMKV